MIQSIYKPTMILKTMALFFVLSIVIDTCNAAPVLGPPHRGINGLFKHKQTADIERVVEKREDCWWCGLIFRDDPIASTRDVTGADTAVDETESGESVDEPESPESSHDPDDRILRRVLKDLLKEIDERQLHKPKY